ncbi:MAG: hypothetical protein IAE77_29440, partial [Prosthecobacter sp.]|uniref:hypothetical protein n=1 Tax=Prosthecobacter sp. TaxID=1965333 RepID=UPI001A049765
MGQVKEKITDNGVKPVAKEKAGPRQVFKLMGASTGQPLVPGSAHVISEQIAGREVKGRATRVDARSFAALTTVKKGEVITFPLHDQEMAQGTVDIVLKDEKGMLRVAGPLDEPAHGRFCFAWNGADAAGMILLQDKKLAYLTQQDAAGNLVQEELLLSAVMCVDFTGGDAQAAASP